MTGTIPKWASEEISAELSTLRETGESDTVEFKEVFPEKLGKEIAAMATSGGGRIFIGINDDGKLCGLTDVDTASARDNAREKAHNIVLSVKPVPIDIDIVYAFESGKTVLVIIIPKQEEPVYYYKYCPCKRDKRKGRFAEPDEVKQLIEGYLKVQSPEEHYRKVMDRDLDFSEALRRRMLSR